MFFREERQVVGGWLVFMRAKDYSKPLSSREMLGSGSEG